MTILSDLADEVLFYPRDYLDIEIVEVDPAVGNQINKDEEVTFKFQATNTGQFLDVENVSFLLEGLNGTEVKQGNGAGAPWGTSYTTPPGYFPRIAANGTPVLSIGSPFTFRPSQRFTTATDLVKVSVAAWDTDLNRITVSRTGSAPNAAGTYQAVVHPK